MRKWWQNPDATGEETAPLIAPVAALWINPWAFTKVSTLFGSARFGSASPVLTESPLAIRPGSCLSSERPAKELVVEVSKSPALRTA